MLAGSGIKGIAEKIEKQIELGCYLKAKLIEKSWEVINNTPLPVVCFR
jgi:aromatic-L-amino-acid/L-tryptophan decarboxylase